MLTPRRVGREDSKLRGSDEAKAPVEGGIAEERDERLARCVGRAKHEMHEGVADAGPKPLTTNKHKA